MNRVLHRSILLFFLISSGGMGAQASEPFRAVGHSRTTIYHSPQSPGYTCWTSSWLMPDRSIWVCFTQATGPIEGRPKTPPAIRKKLSWPPGGIEGYDMNGLKMENIYLRSADEGKSWTQVSSDVFRSPINAMGGIGTVALRDGTILREVLGEYLPFDDDVPATGFLQKSIDRARTWSKPILFLNPEKYTTWPIRIRVLKDGRILVLGGFVRSPAQSSLTRNEMSAQMDQLMVVSDDGGATWNGPLEVLSPDGRAKWKSTEEWDLAELPGGDLLCLFRRDDPDAANVRWQAVLKKHGNRWLPGTPSPTSLGPGGHPELLMTKEGIVLYLTTGNQQAWTDDAGKTWHSLEVPIGYYPRSVQTPDGQIYVFSHVGGDDAYGAADQSILMDKFRLSRDMNR